MSWGRIWGGSVPWRRERSAAERRKTRAQPSMSSAPACLKTIGPVFMGAESTLRCGRNSGNFRGLPPVMLIIEVGPSGARMRIRGSIVVLCLTLSATNAHAEWSLGAGPDFFSWTEDTAPLTVKETGTLAALRGSLSQQVANDFHVELRGRFYFGEVVYNGSLLYDPSIPAKGSARYTGATLQGMVRHPLAGIFEAVGGFDYDTWRRTLATDQVEEYQVFSLRLGVEHAFAPSAPWLVGAGFKFTLLTHEDAHFDELGFDQNPALRPGNSVTPFLDLGYAFNRHWSVAGSYDGFSFGASNKVTLVQGGLVATFYQPASVMRILSLRLEYR